jgi:hypothetical protein
VSGLSPEGQRAIARLARDADVLAAFRKVTGWTDEDVLHYASCGKCQPFCVTCVDFCRDAPASIAMDEHIRNEKRGARQ